MKAVSQKLELWRGIGRPLYFLGLLLTFIVLSPQGALAQQSLELPVPQSQGTQRLRPRPKASAAPVPRNNVQTIPPAAAPPPVAEPQAEEPPPAQPPPAEVRQPEPVLPAVFRGCWRGVVDQVDRLQRLPSSANKVGRWMPKTYMLCYRRVGNGPFQPTFTSTDVHDVSITNTSGRLQVISTDGRSYARMRAYLHFDEFRRPPVFPASTFPVDEVTDLQCTIEPDGTMHATGVVYGEREGEPWFRAWWHATFFHVSSLSE